MSRCLDVIERVCGARPEGCPWRAFADPVVQDVLALSPALGGGDEPSFLDAVMEPDPPALLVDSLLFYRHSLNAVWAEDKRIAREKADRERAARAARKR